MVLKYMVQGIFHANKISQARLLVFRHLSLTLVDVVKAINDILIGREFVMVRIVPLVQATVPLFIGEFFVHLKVEN